MFDYVLGCNLSIRHQHPLCVRSRARPVQHDRPTGCPPRRYSLARPDRRVLCPGGRSHPVPSHWGHNRSRAGHTPRQHPVGPTGHHTLCPISHSSTAPPAQHSGLILRPAAQPGGLRTSSCCQLICYPGTWVIFILSIYSNWTIERKHSFQSLQITCVHSFEQFTSREMLILYLKLCYNVEGHQVLSKKLLSVSYSHWVCTVYNVVLLYLYSSVAATVRSQFNWHCHVHHFVRFVTKQLLTGIFYRLPHIPCFSFICGHLWFDRQVINLLLTKLATIPAVWG